MIAAVTVVGWIRFADSVSNEVVDADGSTVSPNGAIHKPPEDIYVFGSTENGEYQGAPSFGTSHQTGITNAIKLALPAYLRDFESIGNENAAREAFLTSSGHTFAHPDRKWNVAIVLHGYVGSELRVAVAAEVGIDAERTEMGENFRSMDVDAVVFEIWQLNADIAPLLLERSDRWFDGLRTHTESPAPPETVPPTVPFGDGVDDMGNVAWPD